MHSFSWRRTMLCADLTAGQYARRAEVEALALAYCAAQRGDDQAARVAAISDVMADLNAAEE